MALQHDSWAEAAEACGVSPSAFSQGIAALERSLGVTLFDVAGRRRTPTSAAVAAEALARRAIAAHGALDDWATATRTGAAGLVRAGMIDTAAIHHFGDHLMRYRRDHPRVDLRLSVASSAELVDNVRAGDLDLAVAVATSKDPTLEQVPLIDEPVRVYPPPGTPAERLSDPTTWGPWVSFPRSSRTRRLVGEALSTMGASFDVVAESSQPRVLREMVRLGMGWTALVVADAETEPHALEPLTPEPLIRRRLVCVRRRDRRLGPAVDGLIQLLVAAQPTP